MTRASTASFGVAILTAIQPLLGAVLILCVSLVHHAATTLGMILNRTSRDWHTETAREDLPQATSGIQPREFSGPPGPRPAVDAKRRTNTGVPQNKRPRSRHHRVTPLALTRAGNDTLAALTSARA